MNADNRPHAGQDQYSAGGVDFWASVVVIFRRWYVVLPVLLLTLGGAFVTLKSIPTRYAAQSSVLLVVPPTGGVEFLNGYVPNPVNPMLTLDPGLNITATMLIQTMRTAEFVDRLDVPAGVTYTVNNGSDNPELLVEGPFVIIAAEADGPDAAQQLVQRGVAAARVELDRIQERAGAPAVTRIQPYVIDPEAVPAARRGSAVRATAAVLALGMIGTVASAFAAESVAAALRRRRRQRHDLTPPAAGARPMGGAGPARVRRRVEYAEAPGAFR